MEQEVERPVKGPLTRRRSGAVSTPERVLRSRTDKSDGSPPATPATALQEGTPSRGGTPKREGTPKKTLKQPADNVTGTPKRRSVRASSAQPEDSPAKRVLTRRRSTSLQPETPKKEDKTITTRSKLSTVASEKTVTPVSTRSRRSVAPSTSTSSEPSSKPSPEPVKEIKRITRRSASNSPARELATKTTGVRATRKSSLSTSPVGSPEPETSSDKTPSLIPRKRHVRNLGLSPVEENKNETAVPDSPNTDVKPDDIIDPKSSQIITTVEPTQSSELISYREVGQIKVEQVSPVHSHNVATPNVHSLDVSVKSEVSSPNGSTSHDKNESCAESEDSGIKEMEEFNSLEDKGSDKIAKVITDQIDIGSEVYEDQNNDPNSKLIQITMADKDNIVKGLDKKNSSFKDDPSKLKTLDTNTSRLSNLQPVVSLVRLNANNIPEMSQSMNEAKNKNNLGSLDIAKPISSNLEEKAETSPVTQVEKNNSSELGLSEGLSNDKTFSRVTPLIKITSANRNQNSLNDSITDQQEDAVKVEKSPENTSETFEGNKIEVTKERGESAEHIITHDIKNVKEKSEHLDKTTASETTGHEDLDFTLMIDTETEAGKSNTDNSIEQNKSKSVQDVFSKSKETENANNLNVLISKEIEPENKKAERDLSLTTEAAGVKESNSTSSNVQKGSTDVSGDKAESSTAPLSPTPMSKFEDKNEVSPDLSSLPQGNSLEQSDAHPMKDLKYDHSGETDISIQTAEASDTSVQDTLNGSQVDTNYSMLVNVSDDSIIDKKEDSKSKDEQEKMNISSDENHVAKECNEQSVEQSICLSESSNIADDTIVERTSDDKPVNQSITVMESSNISNESLVESTSDDKPADRSITVTESSSIFDESIVENKSGDNPVNQSITVMESSSMSDETIVESTSGDKPADQSITVTESSSISDETVVESTSDDKSVDQSITVMERSSMSDETIVENTSDDKPVDQSIIVTESSSISDETIVENKCDKKSVEQLAIQIEGSASSNETTVENNSDKTSSTDIMDCTIQAATSDNCKKPTSDKISDKSEINSSGCQTEISSASDESLIKIKSNNDPSTNEQATNQVDTPSIYNKNKSEEQSISDDLEIVNVDINSDDETKNEVVANENSFSICDETLVQNKSTNDLDSLTSQADASSVCDETVVLVDADEKSVSEALECSTSQVDISGIETTVDNKSAENLNQSASQFDSSSVCDKSITPGDSSTDTLEYPTTQADISGTSDETMSRGKSAGDALDHSTDDTSVKDQTDTSVVCEQQPSHKKTSDDNVKDTIFDTKSEGVSKAKDKSSDEVDKIISLDYTANESQDPFIEGAHADQSDGEKLNTTFTLSDSEPEEVVLVNSSTESDDSEQIVSKKETGNNQKVALPKQNIYECQVEEESSSESSSSESEDEGLSSSPLFRTRDFIDDEAEEGEETKSSDDSFIDDSELVHIQQKKCSPKKKRQFVVNDESCETQSSSEDLSPHAEKQSRLSCFGHSKDKNIDVSKKSNVPFMSDRDKKDKERTLKKESKSSVQKKSNIRKITPSSLPVLEVVDSNNKIVGMDGDCSESYLTHHLANNINNSHATGGVFKVESQTDYSKHTGGQIKNKISCNINFKVEKYHAKSSESSADKSYFCGIKFEITQQNIRQIKSLSGNVTALPKNNESSDSGGKLKKREDCSTLSSRLMETDNFNWNSYSEEAKAKKSKRRKLDATLQSEDLHSITLHDSSSEPECSRSKPEVDTYQLLMEQPFSQPKIKCPKPCYSATIQNLGTGINALDLISLFTKLGIQGIEDIDLSTCPPRLFCKKLGYGNIRFSNEEAMQQCVDMSRKVKLRGEELWMRACYCYKPLTRKASQWLSQSNTQFSEKKLKYMRKQKRTAQT